MATKLYVGGLSYSVTDAELRKAFEEAGKVEAANVMIDRYTSQSRGFGFVEMGSDAEAEAAIKELNGKQIGGRAIMVNAARPQEDKPRNSSGGTPGKFNNRNNRPRY